MSIRKIRNRKVPSAQKTHGGDFQRSSGSFWTSREERYLIQHRTDGAELIAHVLGRSVSAVKHKAHRLRVSLAYRPGDTCPVCGQHSMHEGTVAAQHGMCLVCWERRKAEQMREARAETWARREYEKQKQGVKRAREAVQQVRKAGAGGQELPEVRISKEREQEDEGRRAGEEV